MLGKENTILFRGVSVVDQNDHAAILFSSDHAPCRLQDTIHAGIGVGIVKAVLSRGIVILPEDIALVGNSGDTRSHDDRADETVSGEIDSLGKGAAQNAKADAKPAVITYSSV